MHCTTTSTGYSFLHNGDYSGDTQILSPSESLVAIVPYAAVRELVAGEVRQRAVRKAESATALQILGLPDPTHGPDEVAEAANRAMRSAVAEITDLLQLNGSQQCLVAAYIRDAFQPVIKMKLARAEAAATATPSQS